MSSCNASGIVQSSTALGCSPLRIGSDSQDTCFQLALALVHLLLQGRVMSVFDEINSSELNLTRSRYSFSSEKLVIFENDPFAIHWRTA